MFASVRFRRGLVLFVSYLVIGVLVVVALFPVFWMASTSFKSVEKLFIIPPQWIPIPPDLSTLRSVVIGDYGRPSNFPLFFKNSVIVSVATMALCLSLSTLAGYSFSRFRFRSRGTLMMLILVTQMFPMGMLLISLYIIFNKGLKLFGFTVLGLNTYTALILANTTFGLPFCIWLLKGFFDTAPRELEDAALIDGCNRLSVLYRVILPIIAPGLVAAGVYVFLIAWDEYLFASTLVNQMPMRTLPPGLVASFIGQFYLNWGNLMAASLIITIPVTLVFIFFQKYLVQGLTAGAVKG